MTSERKQKANRANAPLSTGPRTAKGKARSAKNALRHGLNVPVLADASLTKEVERMAHRIAGKGARGELLARARAIAEAQIDLQRVRAYRLRRTEQALAHPKSDRPPMHPICEPPIGLSEIAAAEWRLNWIRGAHKQLVAQVGAALARSDRVQSTAGSAAEGSKSPASGAMLRPAEIPMTSAASVSDLEAASEPQAAEPFFTLADELASLDRYERRALSRSKFAIREFDRSGAGKAKQD